MLTMMVQQWALSVNVCHDVSPAIELVRELSAGVWDCIVTCFFIDTAHNVVDYIEVLAKALKEGGTWINLGPLLWHFASTQDSQSHGVEEGVSVELSLQDVKRLASGYGFRIETERVLNTTYTANCRSMMKNWYTCAMWTMKKEFAHGHCTMQV